MKCKSYFRGSKLRNQKYLLDLPAKLVLSSQLQCGKMGNLRDTWRKEMAGFSDR